MGRQRMCPNTWPLDMAELVNFGPAQGNDRHRYEVAKSGDRADGAIGVRLVLAPDDGAWLNGIAELGLEFLQEATQPGLLLLDGFDAEVVWGNQSETVDVDREFDVDVRQAEHRCPEGQFFRLSHWRRPV